MLNRIATVFSPADLTEAGTKVIPIDISDVISRIDFFWQCTNVTVSAMLDAVTACLSSIELVDGSEVISSVSGAELQGVNFYDRKIMPHHEISLTVGGYFEVGLSLDFGRWLWDTEYAFDPKRFTNPQLLVTWDEDACNTAAEVNRFSSYAHVFEPGVATPGAMLVNRRVKEYPMVGTSHEYTKLPVDRIMRKVLIRGYSEDHDPIALFDTIKLNLDGEKEVPINIKAEDLDRYLALVYPRIHEFYTLDAAITAKTLYSALSKDQQVSISYDATVIAATATFAVATWTGAKCALSASIDIKGNDMEVSGRMPANCFPLDFGVPGDPATWFPANQYGSAVLDLLDSSDADSGDTVYLVVQQVMPY